MESPTRSYATPQCVQSVSTCACMRVSAREVFVLSCVHACVHVCVRVCGRSCVRACVHAHAHMPRYGRSMSFFFQIHVVFFSDPCRFRRSSCSAVPAPYDWSTRALRGAASHGDHTMWRTLAPTCWHTHMCAGLSDADEKVLRAGAHGLVASLMSWPAEVGIPQQTAARAARPQCTAHTYAARPRHAHVIHTGMRRTHAHGTFTCTA